MLNTKVPNVWSQRSSEAPEVIARRIKERLELTTDQWLAWAFDSLVVAIWGRRVEGLPTDLELRRSRESFEERFRPRVEAGTAAKYIKFHLLYLAAILCHSDEFPAPPGALDENERPGIPCGGVVNVCIRRWITKAKKTTRIDFRHFNDLLQCKKGMPPVDNRFIRQALEKHEHVLCDIPDESDKFSQLLHSEEATIFRGRVCSFIDRLVSVLFSSVRWRPRALTPSLNSCFDGSRNKGGQMGVLFSRFLADMSPIRTWELCNPLSPHVMIGMYQDDRGGICDGRIMVADRTDLITAFQTYIDQECDLVLEKGFLDATPVAIPEPLKVRVITKGDPCVYYRTLEFQKTMHEVLRRTNLFRYIGQPIDEQNWTERFYNCGISVDYGDFGFCSGDYEASTDFIDSEMSAYAWQSIASHIFADLSFSRRQSYERLGLISLIGHRLHYDDRVRMQHNGQLMGSPMSFPILCIVNAAATICSQNWDTWDWEKLPLAVNGDDTAFCCTREGYDSYRRCLPYVGLRPSPGKNYFSKQFLQMNSEIRRYGGRGEWTPIGYLNQAILTGRDSKGQNAGWEKDTYWTDLEGLSREFIRWMSPKDQGSLMKLFLKSYKPVIAEASPFCNKWIPKELGGMGLPIPQEFTLEDLEKGVQDDLLARQFNQATLLLADRQIEKSYSVPPSKRAPFFAALKLARSICPHREVCRSVEIDRSRCGPDSVQFLGTLLSYYTYEELTEYQYGDLSVRWYLEDSSCFRPMFWGRVGLGSKVHQSNLRHINSLYTKRCQSTIGQTWGGDFVSWETLKTYEDHLLKTDTQYLHGLKKPGRFPEPSFSLNDDLEPVIEIEVCFGSYLQCD